MRAGGLNVYDAIKYIEQAMQNRLYVNISLLFSSKFKQHKIIVLWSIKASPSLISISIPPENDGINFSL